MKVTNIVYDSKIEQYINEEDFNIIQGLFKNRFHFKEIGKAEKKYGSGFNIFLPLFSFLNAFYIIQNKNIKQCDILKTTQYFQKMYFKKWLLSKYIKK